MKRAWLFLLTCVLAGVGAVAGSILGNGAGQRWLFVGAVLGGSVGSIAAAYLASRLRLIAPHQARGVAVGGLLGFILAAPLAASNLGTPVVPVFSTALTGLGALLGGFGFAAPGHSRPGAEAIMIGNLRLAVAGFALLLPSLVLTSSGLLGLEPPAGLTHPVLVMSGLLMAFTLNALSVLRVHFGHDEDRLVGTISVRVRGTVMNLTALMISSLLFAIIAAYLFVENFQPR